MKRIPGSAVVASKRSGASRDVAGAPVVTPVIEVASYLSAFGSSFEESFEEPFEERFEESFEESFKVAGSGASWSEDFAEFLAGDEASDYALQPPDPAFREMLRRRLWRMHVVTHLRDGQETH